MSKLIEEQEATDSKKKQIPSRGEDIRSSDKTCTPSPESKVLRPKWEDIFGKIFLKD